MAEGLCRNLNYDVIMPFSAGIVKHGLNPCAVEVMQEMGIDISKQFSKTVEEIAEKNFDYVVTVCDNAYETCPYFPAKTAVIHRSFDDPPKLAKNAVTKEEALSHYRRVRDEIRKYIQNLPELLEVSNQQT
ncbi:MAG: arsenate reductase ArsC [bacterium]|nr:arsenate reductase ArsC [bacterium]